MSENTIINGSYGTMYHVYDMEKAQRFYKEVLGLQPTFESEQWTEFDTGGHLICLHATEAGDTVDGRAMLITRVSDIKNVRKELEAKGVEFVSEINQVCDGGYAMEMKDPSGNVVSLFEFKGD